MVCRNVHFQCSFWRLAKQSWSLVYIVYWHHCSVGFSIVITCVIHSVDYEGGCVLYTVDMRDWWRLLADGSLLPTELFCAPVTNCKQNVPSSSNIISCALENIHCDFTPHNTDVPFRFGRHASVANPLQTVLCTKIDSNCCSPKYCF